ncbi:hypothetical protein NIES4075_66890 [Tolypothrix sp. NIES-4075]|uniref:DUF6519 domain-containing protein n=1 Tax=Tolypothrix sp. NIES-4075 TaxID=2005459 RepID=UPI000B5C768D|nr:DUF6519 domain-containing protein [Tolypothrix sp. NIES-4075]GAX45668.1 hypothetical protein NIES4075_66890 [Tolypothrix sp. NIES-4075]
MKGDFSRQTFDPKKHYSAVLMQQGRVQVDADWNEQQALESFRIETEAIDVIGRCGAPKNNPGFAIAASGTQLSIGQGRYYVDGILCQNEATVTYEQQPDFPDPPNALDGLSKAIAGIIYLDVWQRHLTALDDPQICEVALGGPDTATRLKTVWQVKVLPIPSTDPPVDINCDSSFPDWEKLIAGSTGKLTAQTALPINTDNPCLIPPTAGYQRLENQLYRVEVHQTNPSLTFKWSRDNGSVVTAVQGISGVQVTVQDIGPDEVLGFAIGQWVEIIDDRLELSGQSGQIVRILDIDSAGQVLTMETAPTTLGSTNGIDPTRHPKLRRWDQTGSAATATGIAVTPNTSMALEGGISVQFDSGSFRPGDYWLIPARTATGQIEWLVDGSGNSLPQSPFGIQHHYCRLAIAQLSGEQLKLQDCRPIFPPLTEIDAGESCCVVVHPGEDIQAAINLLPATGGCVCLKTGIHAITQAIRIERSHVTLQGANLGAKVVRSNGINALAIVGTLQQPITDITVEQIQFETVGTNQPITELLDLGIVSFNNCRHLTLIQCQLAITPVTTPPIRVAVVARTPAIGIIAMNSSQSKILANQLNLLSVGIWTEGCAAVEIAQNELNAPTFAQGDSIVPLGLIGINLNISITKALRASDRRNCRIEHNRIENYWVGVNVGEQADNSQIVGNQILRRSPEQFPVDHPLVGDLRIGNEPYLYGIIVKAKNCRIAQNELNLNNVIYGGIRASDAFTQIENNTLTALISGRSSNSLFATVASPPQFIPVAIFLAPLQTPTRIATNSSVIRHNTLLGQLSGIVVLAMEGVEILNNQIEITPDTLLARAIALASSKNATIAGNQIQNAQTGILLLGTVPNLGSGNRLLNNRLNTGTFGILAVGEVALEVSHNVIENMAIAGLIGSGLLESTRLAHNRVTYCGYLSVDSLIGSGIAILNSLTDLCIESCEVLNIGLARDELKQSNPDATWGIVAIAVPFCRISHNAVGYTDLNRLKQLNSDREHRALSLTPPFQPINSNAPQPPIGIATVTDNLFAGLGSSALVQIYGIRFTENDTSAIGFEKVTFSNNVSQHLGNARFTNVSNAANVFIEGQHLIVMGNHIKETPKTRHSFYFNYHVKAVYIGNLTTDNFDAQPSLTTRFVPPSPALGDINAVV